jgi:hypothetical protein
MLLYIAATNQVVSTALMVERAEDGKEHRVQRPVYYLSEVLSPTKQRYPPLSEAGIRHLHDGEEVAPLLQVSLNHSGGFDSSVQYP